MIITLWLFQILNNYLYRETLEKAKNEGFNVPSLCDYHYRVKQLDDELLKSLLEECAKLHESEIEMLRKALKKLQPQKGLPFIADIGYDAVDIIESLLDRGFGPAVGIKEHPLRKLSNENWKR